MTARAILVVSLIAVGVVCVALVTLTIVARVARRRRDRHLQALAAPHRMLLLTVAAGEDDDEDAMSQLRSMSDAEWKSVRPAVLSLLGKVRGTPAVALVGLVQERGEVDRARRNMASRSPWTRARAAHLAGIVRDEVSVPTLVALLEDTDEDVRVVAARALGRIGDPVAAFPILHAAGPRSGSGLPGIPAWIAAEALLALGDDAAATIEDGIASPDAVTRSVAVTVATHGTLPGAVDLVRAHIATERDLDVLGAMVDCLGRVGRAEDAALLVGLTGSGTPPGLRRQAVRALGDIGGQTASDCLADLLGDADRATAAVAADALVELGAPGVAILHDARSRRPQTGRVVSAALHLAGLRGNLRDAS